MKKLYRIQHWRRNYNGARWMTLHRTRTEDAALLFVEAFGSERTRTGDTRYPDLRLVLGSDVLILIEGGQPKESTRSIVTIVGDLQNRVAAIERQLAPSPQGGQE